MLDSFRELIDRFGIGEFASIVGCSYGAAKQMRRRNSVSPEYWPAAIAEAARRQMGDVTGQRLAEIAAAAKAAPERPSGQTEAAA